MSLYSIRWDTFSGSHVVVGNQSSVIQLALIFENAKEKFKVADVAGVPVSQEDMGCGDFKFWLRPEEKF